MQEVDEKHFLERALKNARKISTYSNREIMRRVRRNIKRKIKILAARILRNKVKFLMLVLCFFSWNTDMQRPPRPPRPQNRAKRTL